MDKKKKELILIAILIPVLIFVIYDSVGTDSPEKTSASLSPEPDPADLLAPADPPTGSRAGPREQPDVGEEILARQSSVAEGPWPRDPFQPPPAGEGEASTGDWSNFQLSGIISGRLAIINGELVAVGDNYRGYRLKQVDQYRIILEKDGQSFTIDIAEE